MGASDSKITPEEENILRSRIRRKRIVLIIKASDRAGGCFDLLIERLRSLVDDLTILLWSGSTFFRDANQPNIPSIDYAFNIADRIIFAECLTSTSRDTLIFSPLGKFYQAIKELPQKTNGYGRIVGCFMTKNYSSDVRVARATIDIKYTAVAVYVRYDGSSHPVLNDEEGATRDLLVALELPVTTDNAKEECIKKAFQNPIQKLK